MFNYKRVFLFLLLISIGLSLLSLTPTIEPIFKVILLTVALISNISAIAVFIGFDNKK